MEHWALIKRLAYLHRVYRTSGGVVRAFDSGGHAGGVGAQWCRLGGRMDGVGGDGRGGIRREPFVSRLVDLTSWRRGPLPRALEVGPASPS